MNHIYICSQIATRSNERWPKRHHAKKKFILQCLAFCSIRASVQATSGSLKAAILIDVCNGSFIPDRLLSPWFDRGAAFVYRRIFQAEVTWKVLSRQQYRLTAPLFPCLCPNITKRLASLCTFKSLTGVWNADCQQFKEWDLSLY